jgi:hypothetical protein
MKKKANLAEALHEASGKKVTGDTVTKSKENESPVLSGKPPSRVGKKVVAGHFDPAVIRQLKLLAMNNDTSIQVMLSEALNDLFAKHNMKPIA